MEKNYGLLGLTDVVWNHTADNSKWLQEHPEVGYNVSTAPWLEAALELDTSLLEFSSKLAETNLVMGIVKLMLIVLAMVFSAAPLPFSDELGPDALHVVWAASIVFYLVANDYFHVVRLKGFIEFWRIYRSC